ncbi:competence/damage-inducible protein A [Pelotomaculum terephthalicicum JT]|uniref:competence/damage-inducible protein A n=1 Tax=Pelotomaculum TaxID=191373 RepID=UPI0009CAF3FE|nr:MULTISPECIES: competence/damage-inducible protein A [Pelotomaculum]MCG9968172.1 competence/damage-inducible protein A [Pelotomaculum terephthalicicum JT]OPX83932.1 MAG: putative competence-damage inducible protein [Pelotomaculum sp. PtaB.Bin117]OPY63191.1 MAG: putative competence-damage inducible protein [Pelotomaculum sp. PtaU1.Bin065]
MKTELIFTGSELLQGRIVNSHAQYLGRRLSELNFDVAWHVTVGDNYERLEQVVRQALERSELILITGGLGPTTDDLTKETVAHVLGLPMILDEKSLDGIREFFNRRGMSMPESNARQAYFPQGATILPNNRGTAPGILIDRGNKIIALLPGPPHELTAMFEETLAPLLSKKAGSGDVTRVKVVRVTGISESAVQDLMKDLGGQGNPGITYLASPGQVQVRITARAANAEQAEKMVEELSEKVNCRLEEYIFSYGGEKLEHIVAKQLLDKGMSIGLAESCTGGLIAAKLTDVPGSSGYFTGGVVAYSNEVKKAILGVAPETIDRHGAVSKETAVAMAEGVRNLIHASLGLAVTGIAGPDGGTPVKPRGLVYIALASERGTSCHEYHFPGDRLAVRMGTVNAALNIVRAFLQEK